MVADGRLKKAKFVQIVTNKFEIYALDEDGEVWELRRSWREKDPPGWYRLTYQRHDK